MTEHDSFRFYLMTITLDSDSLTVEAHGKIAAKALGAESRTISYADINAVHFKRASRLTNGRISFAAGMDSTVVHFRHKDNATAEQVAAFVSERANAVTGEEALATLKETDIALIPPSDALRMLRNGELNPPD
jgi:hypothetical protein